jgi:hypothetical protein
VVIADLLDSHREERVMRHRIMEALALLGGALLAASMLLQGPGGLLGDPTSSASVRAGTSDTVTPTLLEVFERTLAGTPSPE